MQGQGPIASPSESSTELHEWYRTTHLLDQSPRDGVECLLVCRKELQSKRPVRLRDRTERRPAEFHATADDARAVVPCDPLRRLRGVLLRGGGRGVKQRDFVEAPAELGVGCRGEGVELAEMGDVRGGEGGVRLEAFEEYGWKGSRLSILARGGRGKFAYPSGSR